MVFLRSVAHGRCDDDTSVARGGDDEDDLDMLLQSTAVLAISPLHEGSGDGSSSEETPCSLAFRLLLRLSLRSHLAIWCFVCCALCAARLFSTTACFWWKIASSGRGALAGTRWAHFNCDDKKHGDQLGKTHSEKINTVAKGE
jgi:hypothetical protein